MSKKEGVDGIEMTKLWDALVEALERIEKVYCVADALDDMDDQHASFIEKLKALGRKRPERIKVLLISHACALPCLCCDLQPIFLPTL